MNGEVFCFDAVAPVRERGLKYVFGGTVRAGAGRSREGAWIEIAKELKRMDLENVAPVRERGLKYQ